VSDDTIVHRDGFTKIRGHRYDAVSGPRINITRQKQMHRFGSGYEDSGQQVPLFQGTESDARYVYEMLQEFFDD
jgi:hypothetical protein